MFHIEILDEKRRGLLPKVATVGESFYLAGGTALALQFGHRDSIDFDFFIHSDIDTDDLWGKCMDVFTGNHIQKTQEEKNTLSIIIDHQVRISFFGYHYPLLEQTHQQNGLSFATPLDIGCMKLSAITSRATSKDYIDLYFILQNYTLTALLKACSNKYPTLDQGLILKSLVYFADITAEPIRFMPGFEIPFTKVSSTLTDIVKQYWMSAESTQQ